MAIARMAILKFLVQKFISTGSGLFITLRAERNGCVWGHPADEKFRDPAANLLRSKRRGAMLLNCTV